VLSSNFDVRNSPLARKAARMIAYGDPSFYCSPAELLAQLPHAASNLDEARSALILAGQLEQAIADAYNDHALPSVAQRFTDGWANSVVSQCAKSGVIAGAVDSEAPDLSATELRQALGARVNASIRFKVPEGFDFYSLFPEQYVAAARRWAESHAGSASRTVLVVGVRSIGTTLSAVVTVTLQSLGWRAQRVTVRPAGHPYARTVKLPPVETAAFALVVDEGPGRSGSSMAAAVVALREHGFAPDCITLLPSHDSAPGSEASADVRVIWSETPRVVEPLARVRWNGHSLLDVLRRHTEREFGMAVRDTADVSGGGWRRHAFASESEWPASFVPFERTKYLFTMEDGRRVLWKFQGLGTRQRAAASRLSIPVLGATLGYAAQQWLEGTRLPAESGSPELLGEVLDHIASVAGPPLSHAEAEPALARLREILVVNTREALGDAAGSLAERLADEARNNLSAGPRYGDGRLGPHEFICTREGRLFKADIGGHDCDHTAVGPQSIWWDFAGLATEWNLPARGVLDEGTRLGFEPISNLAFAFYRASYAAFQLGLISMSYSSADEKEAVRLQAAEARFRDALRAALQR
jgi:hypothetical protein